MACCDLMPCCFVPAFQVKERSERTERKVSTALFLHGDWFFCPRGNNGDLRFDLFVCFAPQTNSQSSAALGLADIIPHALSHIIDPSVVFSLSFPPSLHFLPRRHAQNTP